MEDGLISYALHKPFTRHAAHASPMGSSSKSTQHDKELQKADQNSNGMGCVGSMGEAGLMVLETQMERSPPELKLPNDINAT